MAASATSSEDSKLWVTRCELPGFFIRVDNGSDSEWWTDAENPTAGPKDMVAMHNIAPVFLPSCKAKFAPEDEYYCLAPQVRAQDSGFPVSGFRFPVSGFGLALSAMRTL